MRKILINLLYYTGLFHLSYIINRVEGRFPILVFHRISPHSEKLTEPLGVPEFENIVRFLSKKYNYCTIEDVTQVRSPCVITFDDATRDFHDYAIDIITRYQIPTLLFVPTEAATTGEEIWTNQLCSLFYYSELEKVDIKIEGKRYRVSHADPNSVKEIRSIVNILLTMTPENRRVHIATIVGLFKQGSAKKLAETLSWKELRNLVDSRNEGNLVTFGSHAHTHESLVTLDRCALSNELSKSKQLLEKELNITPRAIAYPFGMEDEITRMEARSYFHYGLTTAGKLADITQLEATDYRYSIPRILVYTSNPRELFLRINGLEILIEHIRGFLQNWKKRMRSSTIRAHT